MANGLKPLAICAGGVAGLLTTWLCVQEPVVENGFEQRFQQCVRV